MTGKFGHLEATIWGEKMKSKRLVAIVIVAALSIPFLGASNFIGKSTNVKADSNVTQTSNITRLGGADRYETSVEISKYGWDKAGTVVIASAESNMDFADAIAGTPLAHSMDAPILLTKHNELPDIVDKEITRLSPKNVIILGGTGVVSTSIEDKLKSKGYSVSRVAGKDRYETSIQIAKQLWTKYPSTSQQVGSDHAVILTTGKQFQYAMSVASTAGNSAILFSDGNTLNQSVSNLLSQDKNLQSINVLGSNKVLGVDGSLYKGNSSLFDIKEYNNVSELEKGEGFLESYNGTAVASDKIFPDSLSGSALAAKLGYKLVLSDGSSFPYTVESYANKLSGGLIFGGTGVVSEGMTDKISAILNKNIPANPNGLKDTDLIPFTDENFKKDVQKALGKTDITLKDAKDTLKLSLNESMNIQDLKYFPNLMSLTIDNIILDDKNIEDLSGFANLEYLTLNDCTFNQTLLKQILKNTTIISDGNIVYRAN